MLSPWPAAGAIETGLQEACDGRVSYHKLDLSRCRVDVLVRAPVVPRGEPDLEVFRQGGQRHALVCGGNRTMSGGPGHADTGRARAAAAASTSESVNVLLNVRPAEVEKVLDLEEEMRAGRVRRGS